MPESGNTKLLQVFSRQARQDPLLNLVLAEGPLVPFEAKTAQPDHNVHRGRAHIQWQPTSSSGVGMVSSVPPRSFRHCR